MADLVATSSQIAPVDIENCDLHPGIPAVALLPGDITTLNSAGKQAKSSAGAAGTTKRCGLTLEKAGTRQGVTILKRGKVNGLGVSALAYGALIYLSDTPGKLADAAGTTSVVVGTVVPMSDSDLTKVAYLDFPWLT